MNILIEDLLEGFPGNHKGGYSLTFESKQASQQKYRIQAFKWIPI